jgi:hypoxanthine phosphoribosyltransferase
MHVKDKQFELMIPDKEIMIAVKKLAQKIYLDYRNANPLFVSVLNGSFIFAADLLRELQLQAEIEFIKISSYQKTERGELQVHLDLKSEVNGRPIIILEDIVDTGNTINYLLQYLKDKDCKSIEIATLLLKPDIFDYSFPVKYVGIEIENKFVIGYGLDYDGFGRNLKHLYKVKEK